MILKLGIVNYPIIISLLVVNLNCMYAIFYVSVPKHLKIIKLDELSLLQPWQYVLEWL